MRVGQGVDIVTPALVLVVPTLPKVVERLALAEVGADEGKDNENVEHLGAPHDALELRIVAEDPDVQKAYGNLDHSEVDGIDNLKDVVNKQ